MDYETREKLIKEAVWLEYTMSERCEYREDRIRLKELADLIRKIAEEY